MSEKKAPKKHNVRTLSERIAQQEAKLNADRRRLAVQRLKDAVKNGFVSEDNKKDYRAKLRDFKALEKAPEVLIKLGLKDEASVIEEKAEAMIEELEEMYEGQRPTEVSSPAVNEDEDEGEDEDDDEDF